LAGQLVGYQTYKPAAPKQHKNPRECRYFTYTNQKVTAYGLEYLSKDNGDVVFLVEGVFDACLLHELGYNALAVLSCDPKHLKEWLALLPYYKVALCDGDDAGRKLAKYADYALDCPLGKDPSDLHVVTLQSAAELAKNHLLNR
jgi:DNA primase